MRTSALTGSKSVVANAHARRFTRQIEALGYRVSIEPAEAA